MAGRSARGFAAVSAPCARGASPPSRGRRCAVPVGNHTGSLGYRVLSAYLSRENKQKLLLWL